MKQYILTFTFILGSIFLSAQIEKGELVFGKKITSEMTPGEIHRYDLNLESNHYIFLQLIQMEMDVEINVLDPKGNLIKNFDSPNGDNGIESILFDAESNGKYTIEVSPFAKEGSSGSYKLAVRSIWPQAVSKTEKVDQLFRKWDIDDSPGAAVAIIQNGKVIYKKGYGMANLEYDIPIETNSVFHVASVSKQFTAFCILLLEAEGKLSLDDDIRKHIPELPEYGKKISIKNLATHTGGLRDQLSLLAMAGWRADDVITHDQIMKLILRQKELNFDPGEKFSYSNTGYTLMAEIVERVSGKSLTAFAKERIFEPLEMDNTMFYDDHGIIIKNRVYSYSVNTREFFKDNLNFSFVGPTSLMTTVEDLAKWEMNYWNMELADKSVFDKFNEPQILNNGETAVAALGQFVGQYKGLKEIQHSGADASYRAFTTRYPDENFAVVVLGNSNWFNPVHLAHDVVDVYLSDKLLEEPDEVKEETASEDDEEDTFDPTSVELDQFEGQFYSSELESKYTFQVKDGQLIGSHTRHPDFVLTPFDEDEFYPSQWYFGDVKFQRNESNTVIGINVSMGDAKLRFEKLP